MNEKPYDEQPQLSDVKSHWGKQDKGNFGYASDEERLEKRGMEDWELVEKLQESQPNIPYWFIAVVVIVLMVGVGLSFPFWGLRPGVKVNWVDWVEDPGFLGAIVYVAIAGLFVRYMTNLYGSTAGNRSDLGKEEQDENSSDKHK
jgi:hypothetical protein